MAERAQPGPRAERTRAAILEAAEAIFAERGFAATRLEDVAERVGIRRASIVYYFKDKREVYDAVLESVFSDLFRRLAEALSGSGALDARVERAVETFVDAVGERPTVARLFLREVADAGQEGGFGALPFIQPFMEVIEKQVYGAPDLDEAVPIDADPVHVAATIAGATVFFVAAMPIVLPDAGYDPVSKEHLAVHKDAMIRILRNLIGTRRPRVVPQAS